MCYTKSEREYYKPKVIMFKSDYQIMYDALNEVRLNYGLDKEQQLVFNKLSRKLKEN